MYLPASHRARRRSRIGRKSRRQLCLYTVIGHARSRDSSVIPRVGGALSPGRGESPLSSPVSRSGFSHESRPHIQDTHRSSNPVKEPLWFVQRSTTESTRPGVWPLRSNSRSRSQAVRSPSATTSTLPSSRLVAAPVSPSSNARARVHHRKPTPWTCPRTHAVRRTFSMTPLVTLGALTRENKRSRSRVPRSRLAARATEGRAVHERLPPDRRAAAWARLALLAVDGERCASK